jgi:hypothetical protein
MTHSGLQEASESPPQERDVGEVHRDASRGQSMTRRRFITVAEAATLRPGRVVHPATMLSGARLLGAKQMVLTSCGRCFILCACT